MEKTQEKTIDQQLIKGLSVKLFTVVIFFIVGAIFAATGIYVNISRDLKDVQKTQAETQKILDIIDRKLEVINTNQQRFDVWQGRIEEKLIKDK